MAKRKIINIDQDKCNGCGLCIPNCPEGALRIIDGKARLISDLFCDGLGACIGHCPQDAITIEEREAEEYGESKVMENIVKLGPNVIKAHLEHLKEHNEHKYLRQAIDFLKERKIKIPLEGFLASRRDARHVSGHGINNSQSSCPGSKIMDFKKKAQAPGSEDCSVKTESQLSTWPVQIALVAPFAPYLKEADLLIAADCVPFAYADFHQKLLKDKVLLVGCPKLDDTESYREKITQILKNNNIKSITYAHMEVPCCFGLVKVIKEAVQDSGKVVSFEETVISIKGERLR